MTDHSGIENNGIVRQFVPETATDLQFYWERVNDNTIHWTFFYRLDGESGPKRRVDAVVRHSDVVATESVPQWLEQIS